MAKQFYDNSGFFKDMETARKTLEFTLFISPVQPIKDNNEAIWIEEALNRTSKCCHKYLFKKFGYRFFGDINFDNKESFNRPSDFFSCCELDETPLFLPAIQDQCVLSAYDSIVRVIGNSYLSAANIVCLEKSIQRKYFAKSSDTKKLDAGLFFGIERLSDEKLVDNRFTVSNLKTNGFVNDTEDEDYIRNNVNNMRGFIRGLFYMVDSNKCSRMLSEGVLTNTRILLSHLPILYPLCKTDKRFLGDLLGLYNVDIGEFTGETSKVENKKAWERLYNFKKSICYTIPSSGKVPVDDIYRYYRLESMFNMDIFNCIAQNIQKVKQAGRPCPSGINDYTSIAFAAALPNIFTRNIFVQYAFECLIRQNKLGYSNFLVSQNQKKAFAFPAEEGFSIHTWHKLFENFCSLFSWIIIPAQEWYFLITLYETVKYHYTEECSSAKDKMFAENKLYEVLKKYIEENATQLITRPAALEKKLSEAPNIKPCDIIVPKDELNGADIEIAKLLTLSQKHQLDKPIRKLSPHMLFDINDGTSEEQTFDVDDDGMRLREHMYHCIIGKNPQM